MGDLKAIETRYKGYRFRSRLEARWAVFFDALGIAWEYEKEGYDFGKVGRYLPDFWLPSLDCWIEIKGQLPTESERALCTELAEGSGRLVHLFWGQVGPDSFWGTDDYQEETMRPVGGESFAPTAWVPTLTRGQSSSWSAWWRCTLCGRVFIDNPLLISHGIATNCGCEGEGILRPPEEAYATARSARFEHGETP